MTRLAFLRLIGGLTAGTSLRGVMPQRPDQGSQPPASAVAPSAAAGVLRARLVIIFGTGSGAGLFVYSPAPGAGNLIASIAAANGTDSFGNAYDAGIVSYTPSATAVAQLISGHLNVGSPGQIAGTGGASPGLLGLLLSTPGAVTVNSGLASAADTAAFVDVLSATANGGGQRAVSIGGPLVLSGESGSFPQQSQATLISNSISNYPVVKPGLSGDTNAYRLGKIRAFNTSDTTINSTTDFSIGSAWNVVANVWYEVRVSADVKMGTAAGSLAKIGFVKSGGATVSDCRVRYSTMQNDNATAHAVLGTTSDNTLGYYTTPGLAASTDYIIRAEGMVQFSAGGTVQFSASEGTLGASWTLIHPSFASLEPDG